MLVKLYLGKGSLVAIGGAVIATIETGFASRANSASTGKLSVTLP
jgi:hypothetical protein